jgi:hypothetical protein
VRYLKTKCTDTVSAINAIDLFSCYSENCDTSFSVSRTIELDGLTGLHCCTFSVSDTLDDILDESGDEEEQDAIVTQVLDEIGIEISGKVCLIQLDICNI